jgi:hypothetical protein
LKRIIFCDRESVDKAFMSLDERIRRRKLFIVLALCLGLAILAPVAVLAA